MVIKIKSRSLGSMSIQTEANIKLPNEQKLNENENECNEIQTTNQKNVSKPDIPGLNKLANKQVF